MGPHKVTQLERLYVSPFLSDQDTHKEEDDQNREDKRSNKGADSKQTLETKRHTSLVSL